MEAVKSFNSELQSLYDVKPPISKAKMNAITRGAIKAVKFYKHVVQSVEKFIIKCKIEYKVPGLYVIDSIVRQSRHQFGPEKDVFAPRFAKNIRTIFAHLFRCPQEEKSKVIRVLNLWLKNQVFPPEVIEPLFNFTDPNHPVFKENLNTSNGILNTSISELSPSQKPMVTKSANDILRWQNESQEAIAKNPEIVRKLEQKLLPSEPQKSMSSSVDAFHEESNKDVLFDRTILDFDYGSDDDDDHQRRIKFEEPQKFAATKSSNANLSADVSQLENILSNPDILRQLQTLQQTISMQQPQKLLLDQKQQQQLYHLLCEQEEEKRRRLQEMNKKEAEFDKHLAQTISKLPFLSECAMKPSAETEPNSNSSQPIKLDNSSESNVKNEIIDISYNSTDDKSYEINELESETKESRRSGKYKSRSRSPYKRGSKRSRTRSRSRSKRYRSRSRERERDRDRHRERDRDRGKDRDRDRDRDRTKDRERERELELKLEREREREIDRRHRGFPPIKKEHLTVCSTTIWVGHLSKLATEEDISDTFGEFGEVQNIHLVLPRGCAYVVMSRRQDAHRCMMKLKNYILYGKSITLAWAPGKGVKSKAFNEYWDIELGASYIPWSKIDRDFDIEQFEEGGSLDEDTLTEWMQEMLRTKQKEATKANTEEKLQAELNAKAFVEMQAKLNSNAFPQLPGPVGLLPPNMLPPPPPPPIVPQFTRPPFNLMMPPPFGVPPPNALMHLHMGRTSIVPPAIAPLLNSSTADDMDTSNDDDHSVKMEVQSHDHFLLNNRRGGFKGNENHDNRFENRDNRYENRDNNRNNNDDGNRHGGGRWSEKRHDRNYNQHDYRQPKFEPDQRNHIVRSVDDNWDENGQSKETIVEPRPSLTTPIKAPTTYLNSKPDENDWDDVPDNSAGDNISTKKDIKDEQHQEQIQEQTVVGDDLKVEVNEMKSEINEERTLKRDLQPLVTDEDDPMTAFDSKPRSLLSPNSLNAFENQNQNEMDWSTNNVAAQQGHLHPLSIRPQRSHWNNSFNMCGGPVIPRHHPDGPMNRGMPGPNFRPLFAPRPGFNQRPNFHHPRGQWGGDTIYQNFGQNRKPPFRGRNDYGRGGGGGGRGRNNWRDDRNSSSGSLTPIKDELPDNYVKTEVVKEEDSWD